MNATMRASLWKQFGASIDMLENAITLHIPRKPLIKKSAVPLAIGCSVLFSNNR
jgi:hypothetical protein